MENKETKCEAFVDTENHPTIGGAILVLVASGIPEHVAEAAMLGAETWPNDCSLPEVDCYKCRWCGNFHYNRDHQDRLLEHTVGSIIFGPGFYIDRGLISSNNSFFK